MLKKRKINNVLFLQPAGGALNFSPPLGLGYVATYLKHKLPEINVKVVDLSVEDVDLEILINSFKPDLIGVTGVTTMARDIRLLLEHIRKIDSSIHIVLGGPHASAIKAGAFSLSLDFVVIGEGEETLFALVKALNSRGDLAKLDGLIFRSEDGSAIINEPRSFIQEVDRIPKIDWSLLPMDKYVVKGTITSSRGCPFNCVFCSQQFGRSWRPHSPEYVFDVIKELVDDFGVDTIRFMDDNPLISKERFKAICSLIIENGYKDKVMLNLNHGTRMDIIDKEVFDLLKQLGVKSLWFGLESAVPEVLAGMRKKTTPDSIANAIALARSCGFIVNAFITIGMPGDTYDRSMETMRYVKKHKVNLVSPAIATPFPGTDLFIWVEQNGRWINRDYETWYSTQSVLFDTEDFTSQERMEALDKWLRFSAFQRLRLALENPVVTFKHVLKNPGIIVDSLRNIFGKPWYQKK